MIHLRAPLGKKAAPGWEEWEAPSAKLPRRQFRLTFFELIVIVSIVGVLAGLLLPSGDWDFSHRFPEPEPNLGNGFAVVAGDYYQGATRGRGWALSILPDGRYSFVLSGCCGVYHRESGSARHVSGHLILSPVKQTELHLERDFLPLKWGGRTYLVPPQRLQKFCDAIIQGDEPRYRGAGDFYAKFETNGRVDGTPELPERWANYLRDNLLLGTVIETAERGRVRADVGSADGVQVGSIFAVQGRDRWIRKLRATSVNDDTCELEEVESDADKLPVEPGRKVVMARGQKAEPNP